MTTPEPPDASAEQWARFLDALERACGECGGTGLVRSVRWRAWHERAGELVRVAQAAQRAADLSQAAQAPHAETEVPTVVLAIERAIDEHMRTRPDEPEQQPCRTCRGTGRVLTGFGRRLAEVLARHGFVRQGDP
ncbi:hypothetical protein [Actinomadura keratinilytica]|jgi:Ribonuclease G/E|uniref:Uncharacterized protein n=1 Tax=Actinomadura keratinilytica TaxID=547461 RepID=A0ABP7Z3L1_9ACTN